MKEKLPFRWRRFLPAQIFFHYLIQFTLCGLTALETKTALELARWIGRFMFVMDRKHRSIATRNMERADGLPRTRREIRRLVIRVYEHFAMGALETYLIPRMIRRGEFMSRVERIDWHHMDEALARGRGAIMVCGHLGNWELTGVALSLMKAPLWSVARPIENPFMNALVNRLRKSWGQKIIPQEGAMRGMVTCLKNNAILALLVDQNVRENGVFVPFLGRPAATIRTPALLALKYGAAIVPMHSYRAPDGSHKIALSAPIDVPTGLDREETVTRVTTAITGRIEGFVRRNPDQWMWLHHRWKTKPPAGGNPA